MSQYPCCQRCGKEAAAVSISYFNTQVICLPCRLVEREHPEFAQAQLVERNAVLNGDYNYPGVGLPADILNLDLPRDSRLP